MSIVNNKPIKVLNNVKSKCGFRRVSEIAELLDVVNATYHIEMYCKKGGVTHTMKYVNADHGKIRVENEFVSIRELKRITKSDSFDFIFIYRVNNA
jgi:hypothetical protein